MKTDGKLCLFCGNQINSEEAVVRTYRVINQLIFMVIHLHFKPIPNTSNQAFKHLSTFNRHMKPIMLCKWVLARRSVALVKLRSKVDFV